MSARPRSISRRDQQIVLQMRAMMRDFNAKVKLLNLELERICKTLHQLNDSFHAPKLQ
jgi:hypothetical protein